MSSPEIQLKTDEILYLAFRATWLSTFDRLQAEYSVGDSFQDVGFLDRLPLASGCATQVQLDMLLATWSRLRQPSIELNDIDKCVCYCATDELAKVGETQNSRLISCVANGPAEGVDVDVQWLASKLRTLQITWPFDVDCAELVRDVSRLTTRLDAQPETRLESTVTDLLDCVGAWQVSPSIIANSEGLLTQGEQENMGCFFQEHPNLMNL